MSEKLTVEEVDRLTAGFMKFKSSWTGEMEKIRGDLDFLIKERDEREKIENRGNLGGVGSFSKPDSRQVSDALRSWIKSGNENVFRDMAPKFHSGLSVDSDPDGGFLVGAVMSNTIEQVMRDYVPLRQFARIETITNADAYEEPWDDRATLTTGWVGERSSRPETATPELKLHRVPAHEIYANPSLTQKVIDDARTNLQTWLQSRIADAFSDAENSAFVNGTGVLQPRGFLTYPTSATGDSTRAWGELEHIPTGSAGAFGSPDPGDELHDVVFKLKTQYRPRARWAMNRSTAAVISKMKDGQGNYLWQTSFREGEPDRLLGFPVAYVDTMPDIAANSLSVAFGDFSRGYLIVDRVGLRILRDPYTSKGFVFLYSTRRVGGDVADFHAIKLLRFAAS